MVFLLKPTNKMSSELQYKKSLITVTEMLNDRGFHLSEVENDEYIEFKKGDDKITLFYTLNPKLCIKTLKNFIFIAERDNLKNILVIYQDSITPFVYKLINTIENINIELFSLRELQYNITRHILQPKFRKVENIGVKINVDNLPVMFRTDPVARYYNWGVGTLIEVERKDITCYRIVK